MSQIDYSIYLVTDRGIIGTKDFYSSIEEAIIGGVTLVQLREKTASSGDFYKIATLVKKITLKYKVQLIVNDRVDIALAIDAEGVHIGQSDIPLTVARRLVGERKIIGVSVATVNEALKAQAEGADYLGVGAVYATATKCDVRTVTLPELTLIKDSVRIPVVAIGGIQSGNITRLKASKIDGVAVVSAILGKPDVYQAAKTLAQLWHKS